ncbi:MAG: hypothetical protein ABIY56_01590 [Dokdonella sp.]
MWQVIAQSELPGRRLIDLDTKASEHQIMQTVPYRSNQQARTKLPSPRPLRYLMAAVFMLAATVASADGNKDAFDSFQATDMTPWTPEVIQAIDAYVLAPNFNDGRFGLDHFAASNSLDQQGLVTARLANGNMVVAGLVPDGVGGGFCGDGTKLCSIGLVRYNDSGQRIAWPNAGENGRFTNNYVVWPAGSSEFYRSQYLRHVSVRGNLIDVLVDQPDLTRSGLGRADVVIATFRDNGEFVGFNTVFGSSGSGSEGEDFYGAQMVQMSSTTMIVAATAYDSFGSFIAVTRLLTNANQTPTKDANWGVPYNPAPNSFYANRLNRYFAPGSYCGAASCDATAGYVAKPEGSSFADFYVAGNLHISGNNWDPVALKISSESGSVKTEFNVTGWSRAIFDDTNSTLKDLVAGLYVYQDDVYMAAQVARKCHNGIGLAKLNGATGGYLTAFGSVGKILFGGQGDSLACIAGNQAAVPLAISATGGRIGIAGYQALGGFGGGAIQVDPMLAVVDAVNGSLLSFDNYPVRRTDGTRYGDGVLYGIYGGTSPTSPFTVSGNGRDESASNTLSYVSGRLIPVSSDRIFANGFNN